MLKRVFCLVVLMSALCFGQFDYTPGQAAPPTASQPPSPQASLSLSGDIFSLDYIKALNYNGFVSQAASANANAWFIFKTAWSNWELNRETGVPPDHPVYQTVSIADFNAYWTDLTAANYQQVDPAKYGLPAGAIKFVPTTLTPVFNPAPTPSKILVGAALGNGFYACVSGDTNLDGAVYTDTRGTFTKHLYSTPWGGMCGWTLNTTNKGVF